RDSVLEHDPYQGLNRSHFVPILLAKLPPVILLHQQLSIIFLMNRPGSQLTQSAAIECRVGDSLDADVEGGAQQPACAASTCCSSESVSVQVSALYSRRTKGSPGKPAAASQVLASVWNQTAEVDELLTSREFGRLPVSASAKYCSLDVVRHAEHNGLLRVDHQADTRRNGNQPVQLPLGALDGRGQQGEVVGVAKHAEPLLRLTSTHASPQQKAVVDRLTNPRLLDDSAKSQDLRHCAAMGPEPVLLWAQVRIQHGLQPRKQHPVEQLRCTGLKADASMVFKPSGARLLWNSDDVRRGPFVGRRLTEEHAVHHSGDLSGHTGDAQRLDGHLVRTQRFPARVNGSNASVSMEDVQQKYMGTLTYPILQAFLAYSMPIVVLLGLFGNFVAFVLLKNSALRSTAHFYLCALTVCDSLTLLSMLSSIWVGAVLKGHLYQMGWQVDWLQAGTRQISLCRARLYATFVCRTVSTWTVAVFSWERCLAVWRPMRFEGAAVGWRSGLVLLGLVATAAAVNSYVIPGLQPNDAGLCRANRLFRIGRNVSLLMQSLAPWLLVLVSNCLIVCTLRRGRAAASAATAADAAVTTTATAASPGSSEEAVLMRTLQPHRQRHRRHQRGVTYRLVAVSFAFLVNTSLLTVCTVWTTVAELIEPDSQTERNLLRDTFWLISFLPFTANFASTCPLYCLAGRKFRRAARLLVTCRLQQMRLARQLLDPSRPTSGLRATAVTNARARPRSDSSQTAAESLRHQQQQTASQSRGWRGLSVKKSTLCSGSKRLRRIAWAGRLSDPPLRLGLVRLVSVGHDLAAAIAAARSVPTRPAAICRVAWADVVRWNPRPLSAVSLLFNAAIGPSGVELSAGADQAEQAAVGHDGVVDIFNAVEQQTEPVGLQLVANQEQLLHQACRSRPLIAGRRPAESAHTAAHSWPSRAALRSESLSNQRSILGDRRSKSVLVNEAAEQLKEGAALAQMAGRGAQLMEQVIHELLQLRSADLIGANLKVKRLACGAEGGIGHTMRCSARCPAWQKKSKKAALAWAGLAVSRRINSRSQAAFSCGGWRKRFSVRRNTSNRNIISRPAACSASSEFDEDAAAAAKGADVAGDADRRTETRRQRQLKQQTMRRPIEPAAALSWAELLDPARTRTAGRSTRRCCPADDESCCRRRCACSSASSAAASALAAAAAATPDLLVEATECHRWTAVETTATGCPYRLRSSGRKFSVLWKVPPKASDSSSWSRLAAQPIVVESFQMKAQHRRQAGYSSSPERCDLPIAAAFARIGVISLHRFSAYKSVQSGFQTAGLNWQMQAVEIFFKFAAMLALFALDQLQQVRQHQLQLVEGTVARLAAASAVNGAARGGGSDSRCRRRSVLLVASSRSRRWLAGTVARHGSASRPASGRRQSAEAAAARRPKGRADPPARPLPAGAEQMQTGLPHPGYAGMPIGQRQALQQTVQSRHQFRTVGRSDSLQQQLAERLANPLTGTGNQQVQQGGLEARQRNDVSWTEAGQAEQGVEKDGAGRRLADGLAGQQMGSQSVWKALLLRIASANRLGYQVANQVQLARGQPLRSQLDQPGRVLLGALGHGEQALQRAALQQRIGARIVGQQIAGQRPFESGTGVARRRLDIGKSGVGVNRLVWLGRVWAQASRNRGRHSCTAPIKRGWLDNGQIAGGLVDPLEEVFEAGKSIWRHLGGEFIEIDACMHTQSDSCCLNGMLHFSVKVRPSSSNRAANGNPAAAAAGSSMCISSPTHGDAPGSPPSTAVVDVTMGTTAIDGEDRSHGNPVELLTFSAGRVSFTSTEMASETSFLAMRRASRMSPSSGKPMDSRSLRCSALPHRTAKLRHGVRLRRSLSSNAVSKNFGCALRHRIALRHRCRWYRRLGRKLTDRGRLAHLVHVPVCVSAVIEPAREVGRTRTVRDCRRSPASVSREVSRQHRVADINAAVVRRKFGQPVAANQIRAGTIDHEQRQHLAGDLGLRANSKLAENGHQLSGVHWRAVDVDGGLNWRNLAAYGGGHHVQRESLLICLLRLQLLDGRVDATIRSSLRPRRSLVPLSRRRCLARSSDVSGFRACVALTIDERALCSQVALGQASIATLRWRPAGRLPPGRMVKSVHHAVMLRLDADLLQHNAEENVVKANVPHEPLSQAHPTTERPGAVGCEVEREHRLVGVVEVGVDEILLNDVAVHRLFGVHSNLLRLTDAAAQYECVKHLHTEPLVVSLINPGTAATAAVVKGRYADIDVESCLKYWRSPVIGCPVAMHPDLHVVHLAQLASQIIRGAHYGDAAFSTANVERPLPGRRNNSRPAAPDDPALVAADGVQALLIARTRTGRSLAFVDILAASSFHSNRVPGGQTHSKLPDSVSLQPAWQV
uniref:G_PROTEIN_RECEP_F1_2 domain-containing protein n=1 Tax=Macrostomum lignano TaxID=282301 RepID=A0A1I8IBV0_9PLAT